jgi:hypothetical protein
VRCRKCRRTWQMLHAVPESLGQIRGSCDNTVIPLTVTRSPRFSLHLQQKVGIVPTPGSGKLLTTRFRSTLTLHAISVVDTTTTADRPVLDSLTPWS